MDDEEILEKLGVILENEYGVLHNVLQNLKARNLGRASCVCTTWNVAARKILEERYGFSCEFGSFRDPKFARDVFEADFTANLVKFYQSRSFCPSFAFVIMTEALSKKGNISERITLDANLRTTAIIDPAGVAKKKRRGDVPNDPYFHVKAKFFRKARGQEVMSLIRTCLPRSCRLICLVTSGVIGTSCDLGTTVEKENPRSSITSMLWKIPGLSFEVVSLHDIQNKESDEFLECKSLLEKDDLKAFLPFFTTDVDEYPSEDPLMDLIKSAGGRFAVGGGVANRGVKLEDMDSVEVMTSLAIGICGGSNVTAASLILPQSVKSVEEVENRLKKFAETGIVSGDGRSFAFIFACLGRGVSHYKKNNVESEAFRKHFPHTPLFGFFGEGEIGTDFNPLRPDQNININKQEIGILAYTSVFVVCNVRAS